MSLPARALDPPVPDADLVAAVRAGDPGALGALYDRHAGMLGRLALRLTRSRSEAEDVVQDLFVGLPEALARYVEAGQLVAWLRRVTVNLALKRLRRARHRGEVALAESPAAETGGASVERIQLRRAVDSLPERLRTVVILKVVEGYSHGEIAELLGISRGASEVRLSRALARLREGMGDHDAA